MSENRTTLKETLDNMIRRASRTGEPARVRLPKGLSVAVKVEGELVSLQLSRSDVFPSSNEWKTVLHQWPGQITVVKEPRAVKASEAYYLKGQVRMAPSLLEKRA